MLNRPEALNAQNQPMRDALVEAIDRLEQDPELLVGIIYGMGDRAFSGWRRHQGGDGGWGAEPAARARAATLELGAL